MHLTLDGSGALTTQLTRSLRLAVNSGTLLPGARLPASRTLAAELGVSRNVVLAALGQLTAEGYLEARRGSGTYVCGTSTAADNVSLSAAAPTGKSPALTALGERLAAAVPPLPQLLTRTRPGTGPAWDFRYGTVPFTGAARQSWSRLLGRFARGAGAAAPAPLQGHMPLRRAVAHLLGYSRGLRVNADQVVITHGVQETLDLCARLLLEPGRRMVLEDPHYLPARVAAEAHGADVVWVPADRHGLCTTDLPAGDAALVYVTPSHQFPLGGVLPLARRRELLAWAAQHGSYVFEDDYDSHYRYDTRPVESLAGLDRSRVIYAGSFSKTLSSGLRVGYVVLPDGLTEPFRRLQALCGSGSPLVTQQALAAFIDDGHFARHLRRAARDYTAKRAALLDGVARHLGNRVDVVGAEAGVHVVLRARDVPASDAAAVTRRMAAAGVRLQSIGPQYGHPVPDRPLELLLSYAATPEDAIGEGIGRLARCL